MAFGSVLAVLGFILSAAAVVTGVVLLWDSREDVRQYVDDTDAIRYSICIFLFTWVSCFLAYVTKHNMFLALSSGLLVSIAIKDLTIQELDTYRLLRDRDELRNELGLSEDSVKKVAAGAVLAYIGVCLAFLVQTFGQTQVSDVGSRIKCWLSALVVLVLVVIGCIVLWSSDLVNVTTAADLDADLRNRVFFISEVGAAVGFVAVISFLSRNYTLMSATCVLAALLGVPLLIDLFQTDSLITSNEDDAKNFRVGAAFVYAGMMFAILSTFWCAIEAGKNINVV